MKNFLGLLILTGLFLPASSFADGEADTPNTVKTQMRPYFGVYRGLAPTDKSAVHRGEIEITLSPKGVSFAMATGVHIERSTLTWTEFAASIQNVDSGPEIMTYESHKYLRAISLASGGGVGFIFSQLKAGAVLSRESLNSIQSTGLTTVPALVYLQGNVSLTFGPTFLFSAAQVEDGALKRAIARLDPDGKHLIPTLANNGRAGEPLAEFNDDCERDLLSE